MGGRGKRAKDTNRQVDLHRSALQSEISDIRRTGELLRAKMRGLKGTEGGSGVAAHSNTLTKKCACCLHRSLPADILYAQCPVCGWIDDPLQNANPDLVEGRNPISLREAQKRWREQQAG